MIETKTLAERVFDWQLGHVIVDAAADTLIALFDFGTDWYEPPGKVHDVAFDNYDGSFELIGILDPNWVPTQEQLQAAWAHGFQRCWFRYQDGTERYASQTAALTEKKPSRLAERDRIHLLSRRTQSL